MDGLPLFKKSRKQLIPFQVRVVGMPKLPVLVVGTFAGPSKPDSVNDLLEPLVQEINDLQERGLSFNDKTVQFSVRAFIADAPMRAFLKATINFNGKHGCLACTTVGASVQSGRGKTVVFESVGALPRTDEGFRSRLYEGHHTGWTLLENISNFDLIKGVPVGDRLHLIDEGVTKKIVEGMLSNKFDPSQFIHWSLPLKNVVSAFLVKTRLPSELRDMRQLNEVALWKATEFRTFLHYISVVVWKDFMMDGTFNHFLLYFCGITILSSIEHKPFWSMAKQMLDAFVRQFSIYYGTCFMSSNVHNLQHVTEEVTRLGPLDGFSTYAFENNMRFIKQCVRSGTKIAEQVAGRLTEQSQIQKACYRVDPTSPRLKLKGRLLIMNDFALGTRFENSWFLTKTKKIVRFVKAIRTASSSISIIGIQVDSWEELFNISNISEELPEGFSSLQLNIYKIFLNAPTRRVDVAYNDIKCKLVPIFIPGRPLSQLPVARSPSPTSIALFPLLHTFQLNS